MWLTLLGCATAVGVKYWFSVLDLGGDGLNGVADLVHFFAQRKMESERWNEMLLADVRYVWVRLCTLTGEFPIAM